MIIHIYEIYLIWFVLVWFSWVELNGISRIVGYFMPNPVDKRILNVRGSLKKFPKFFCLGTFIDSTHMTL